MLQDSSKYYEWTNEASHLNLMVLLWCSIKRLSGGYWTMPVVSDAKTCSRVTWSVVSEWWYCGTLSTSHLHCTPQCSASSTCMIQQLGDSSRQCYNICHQSQHMGCYLANNTCGLSLNYILSSSYNWNKTNLFHFYFRCSYMWNKTEMKHWNNSEMFSELLQVH